MEENKKEITIKGETVRIVANSKNTVKIGDNFFSIEATEERTIPTNQIVDMKAEWDDIFNSVNTVVDDQIINVKQTFKNI